MSAHIHSRAYEQSQGTGTRSLRVKKAFRPIPARETQPPACATPAGAEEGARLSAAGTPVYGHRQLHNRLASHRFLVSSWEARLARPPPCSPLWYRLAIHMRAE